jgi:hypothetical protein
MELGIIHTRLILGEYYRMLALFEIFKKTFYPSKKGNLMSYDTLSA